ncbi:hypothetical protein NE237_003570 [Protea cynaroides]|uniref:Cinnamoyl CoA reductase n=1 Tax=Protea cynaroides TaxID=273540 RepID=A0A9Q0KHL5_9MAGN|nr:hypothetical protein NE237_003570 [Protea cynaroides]
MLEPAVSGTINVMNAAETTGVRRVVFTSSVAVVHMDPNRSPNKVVDETCWSDLNYVMNIPVFYILCRTIGPLLQPNVNASAVAVLKTLNGRNKTYSNSIIGLVHVSDIALAHILVYENPLASGRFLCIESVLHRAEINAMFIEMFPGYPIPIKCSDEVNPRVKPFKFSNQRLRDLGLEFTPLKKALWDTVISLQQKGDTLVQQVPHVQGVWVDIFDEEESIAADDEVQAEKDGDVRSRMSELAANQANGEMNDITTSDAGTESVDVAPIPGATTIHDENARSSDTFSASRATLSRVDGQVMVHYDFHMVDEALTS